MNTQQRRLEKVELVKDHSPERSFQRALQFITLLNKEYSLKSGDVLFLGTKDFHKDLAKLTAFKCNQSFVNQTWKPGTLTNWNETEKRIKDLHSKKILVENHIGNVFSETANRSIDYKVYESYARADTRWGGLLKSEKEPRLIICLNPESNKVALREAQMRLIPIIKFGSDTQDVSDYDHNIVVRGDKLSYYLYCCNVIAQHLRSLY
jgi:ribosomal protein S2